MGTNVRLAVVMDPIGQIKFAKDTTLALLLAAQARGWALSYLEPGDLRLRDGVAEGRARPLSVKADPQHWYTLGPPQVQPLGAFDVILMRKDPPFDTEFIYMTYILERAEDGGALGGESAPRTARHEREGLHRLVPAVLRTDAGDARHGRRWRPSPPPTARSCASRCTAWAATPYSCSSPGTRTRAWCSRR